MIARMLAWCLLAAWLPAACAPSEQAAATIRERDGAAVLQRIGLTLPATAKVEFVEQFRGLDDAARLVIVLPRKDWDAMLASLRRSVPHQPPFSIEQTFILGTDEGQWKPNSANGLSAAQYPWKGGTQTLNLGVAPAGPGHVRLFVFWHEM